MEFKDLKNTVIYCGTEEEAKQCCDLAGKLGWKWSDGSSYLEKTQWCEFGSKTCYNFYGGFCCKKIIFERFHFTIKQAQWFLNNFKINKDMEERNIKVSLATAKEWYKGSDKTLKQLALQAYKEEELKENVRVWEDLVNNELEIPIDSCLIGFGSELTKMCIGTFENTDKNVFIDDKHAKSSLAMSQISQLFPYYGNEITDKEWEDSNITKYIITRLGGNIDKGCSFTIYNFLAFHTKEQLNDFLKYNERLVKDYLMLD